MRNLQQPKAFVLGLFETGLAVARALGRKGIDVQGYDFKKDIGFYSKYVEPKICPHPLLEGNKCFEFLAHEAQRLAHKPVLYITSDEFIPPIISNYEILGNHFLVRIPPVNVLRAVANKYKQYQLAMGASVSVPATVVIKNREELANNTIPDSSFPVFVKGIDSNAWRKRFGGSQKGFTFRTRQELLDKVGSILDSGVGAIAQELIAGPDTNHYKFCGYVDKTGELVAGFCLRKIRQNPIHFGVGSAVESIDNEELFELGKRFFLKIGYRGIGSAEFKFDEKDRKYKLIELNPRYWQQNILPEACGINFPLIQYLDLTSGLKDTYFRYKSGVKWVNIYSDFDSFLAYKREGSLTFMSWIRSLKGPKVFSDWAWDDPIPGLYEIRFGRRLIKIPRYLIRRLGRK